jgi:hypothetical protein|tara:strand:- start:443 stop:1699 length:1257 start_codon:yes stop_codon:yes gene_type:complete
MADPTLAMIPSGYKPGKLYSVLPENGDGDFTTFTRSTIGTRVNEGGYIEDVAVNKPRLDYTNGNCPVLLLEPTITNLQIRSSEFDNIIWSKTGVTVTANNIISPNGYLSADKIFRGSNAVNYINAVLTKSASQLEYTSSIFVKQGEGDYFALRFQGNYSDRIDIRFQFSTKSIIYSNAASSNAILRSTSVKEYNNGWFRISASYLSDTRNLLGNYFSPRNTSGDIDSSDTGLSASVFLWGAMIQQNTFLTSYIETTDIQISKSEDVCQDSGDLALFNSIEGSMFVDIQKAIKDSSSGRITISDTSSNNRVAIGKESNNNQFRLFVAHTNGTIDAQKYTNVDFDVRNKFIITWKLNNFKFYQNGSLIHVDILGSVPTGLNALAFNENNLGGQDFFGQINNVQYYNTAISQAEAEALTTI